jgi:hypothetical protein
LPFGRHQIVSQLCKAFEIIERVMRTFHLCFEFRITFQKFPLPTVKRTSKKSYVLF